MRHLAHELVRPDLVTRVPEFARDTVLGAILYPSSMSLLFKVNIWNGIAKLHELPEPLFAWGTLMLGSLVVGSWSVGGALTHCAKLLWKWVRLYEAGGK